MKQTGHTSSIGSMNGLRESSQILIPLSKKLIVPSEPRGSELGSQLLSVFDKKIKKINISFDNLMVINSVTNRVGNWLNINLPSFKIAYTNVIKMQSLKLDDN